MVGSIVLANESVSDGCHWKLWICIMILYSWTKDQSLRPAKSDLKSKLQIIKMH